MTTTSKVATLRIGDRDDGEPFTLPLDVVTSSLAILGIKGSGKTWAAGVVEEEMAGAHVPFVVLDPMGAHIGIKQAYRVVVFGGLHADVPLAPDLGGELADTIIAENMSAIADISQFSDIEQRRFVASFGERLLAKNTSPRHVFIEEAQEFTPQTVGASHQASHSAIDRMVRLGRQRGLGTTLISQRAAIINKSVLSQCGTIVIMRTVWNTDVAVFHELLRDTVPGEDLELFTGSIRGLPTGTAWVWSPHDLGVFARVKIRPRRTFHAGATPSFGEGYRFEPVKVDASALAERFAAIVQAKEAERSEVTQLKLKVTALEKQADSLRQQADIAGVIRKAMAGEAPASDVAAALEEARQELATANGRAEALEVELSKAREGEDRTLRGARLLTEGLQLLVGTGAVIDAHSTVDIDELASKVAARLPHTPTTVVLKPTEALRKDYLEREAQRLADDIRSLMPRQRDLLLWLWQHADYTTLKNWIVRVTGQESLTGGGGYKQVREEIQGLIDRRLVTTDSHGFQVAIGARVAADLSDYKATSAELEAVLNRALSILQQREGTV